MTPKTVAQVAIGGAAAVIVGVLLPWLSATAPLIGTVTRNGVDNGGDGIVLAVLAGIGAIVEWSRYKSGDTTAKRVAVVLLALAAAGVLFSDVVDIRHRIADLNAGTSTVVTSYGMGLYVCGAGIIASFVAAASDVPNRPLVAETV